MNQRNPRDSCFPWVGSLNGYGEKQVSINRLKKLVGIPVGPFPDDFVCGAAGIETSKKDPFYAPCAVHDARFVESDTNLTMTRKEADKEFLNNMLDVARITGKWYLVPKAYLYYGIARALGGLFFGPKSLL